MSNLDYIKYFPVLIIAIFLISLLSTYLIKPEEFKKSRVFVSMMASVAVVILGFNVLISTISMELQKNITKAQFTKLNIDKSWLFPNQLISENSQARPEFLASLYYSNLDLFKESQNLNTKKTVDSILKEQYIAIVLFQCWEDYLTMRKFDETGDAVWLVNFLQWSQSPYLKEEFNRLKYNFAPLTISFGELLFEYSRTIPVPTTDIKIYKDTANLMLADARLKDIYEERSHF
jgi:hypothetical protein